MKNNYIRLTAQLNNLYFSLLIVLLSITFFSSCTKEDDTPPPSAYVEPPPPPPGENVIALPIFNEVPVDFETSNPEFTAFGQLNGDLRINVVENPVAGGINTSFKVVEVVQTPGTETWAGFFFDLAEKIDFSVNRTIKLKVYSPAAGQQVNLKIEDQTDNAINKEVIVETTLANEWEELSFDFSSREDKKFDRAVLFFNFLGVKDAETIHYFDDIVMVAGGGNTGGGTTDPPPSTAAPATAAPIPTLPQAEVIAVFSDTYTNIAGTDFNPDWGQATEATEVEIDGDNTLKYENLNFQGTTFRAPLNVAGMSFLHIDYWTDNATELSSFLISPGPSEFGYPFEVKNGQWVGVDIPLSEFSSVVNLNAVFQMKFEGNGTVYLDNIYFHKGQVTGPSVGAPIPSVAAEEVLSIFSDTYENVAGTDFNPNWGQATIMTEVEIDGNKTLKYENLNYQGTMIGTAIDVSEMAFLHVDYWTDNSTGFNGFIISPGPLETPHAFEVITGEWVSVDIPMSTFSEVVDLTQVFQLKFDGDGTIYLDNIYFYK